MFKNLIRELERLEGTTSISVPLEADAEGYIDKECPSESCLFQFKVHEDDWKNIVRDEEVFCPACRHRAPAKSWYTHQQIEAGKEYAFAQVRGKINRAMRTDARDWNRRQPRNAFIQIGLTVKGGSEPLLLPITAAEPMRLRYCCEECNCRYSYVGAAFFCPSCGMNSASHTFRQTLGATRAVVNIRETLEKTLDRDQAAVVMRSLLEKGIQDAVTCFQRLAEEIYALVPGAEPARKNAFQNLDAGSQLWTKATGVSFDTFMSAEEMARLRVCFQRRHVIAHRQGIVDQNYIDRSGDISYAVGQRLILHPADVLDYVDLIEKLGGAMLPKVIRR